MYQQVNECKQLETSIDGDKAIWTGNHIESAFQIQGRMVAQIKADYCDVEKRYWFDRSFLMDVAVNLDVAVQVSTGADPRTGTDPNTFTVHTRISPGHIVAYLVHCIIIKYTVFAILPGKTQSYHFETTFNRFYGQKYV